ncbi:MAG: cupin domain-containing protein [Promethearchaeota archaeon]|nr:MAG: cupin domain-containing protein [Candidatus Lokiarchaeota archaeon]
MIKKSIYDVEEEMVTKAGSTETTIKWLITEKDGPTHFATRRFEINPGGKVGLHQHPEEHHVYVLNGTANFVDNNGVTFTAKKDDVVYIPPNELHSIINEGVEIFSFICIIPYLK